MDIVGKAGAYQLFASLSQTLKPLEPDPNAYARWLDAYIFRYGELYPWHKKIADITGSSLKTDEMLKYFTSGQ
jgi:Zn-dependent M32 family carboxypeptidase